MEERSQLLEKSKTPRIRVDLLSINFDLVTPSLDYLGRGEERMENADIPYPCVLTFYIFRRQKYYIYLVRAFLNFKQALFELIDSENNGTPVMSFPR